MNLNFYENDPSHIKSRDYKKYLVFRETGHVLGFHYEHQHPKLGEDIFIKEVVKRDLPADSESHYIANFSIKGPSDLIFWDPIKDSVMNLRYVFVIQS